MTHPLFLARVSLFTALLTLFFIRPAPGEEEVRPETPPPTLSAHQGLGLRTGLLLNTLIPPAHNTEPFFYLDIGLRYQADDYYFDLRLPALILLLDGLISLLLPENPYSSGARLADKLNRNIFAYHVGYFELGSSRLGSRFILPPPQRPYQRLRQLSLAMGIFATAELLIFNFRRDLTEESLVEFGYDDPLLISAGLFGALGADFDEFQVDFSLGAAMALRGVDVNRDRRVIILLTELDLQLALTRRLALYLRPRLTTYFTRLTPAATFGAGLTTGVNIRL